MTSVVKSLRVEPSLWTRVEAFASKHSMKANSAALVLLDIGLKHDGPVSAPPRARKAQGDGPAVIRPKPGQLLDKKSKRWRV